LGKEAENERKSRERPEEDPPRPAGGWGDVELVDVLDGIVSVRLTGACGSCPMSTMTLKMGVERAIRQEVPEMKKLMAV
jgi:Fe-S cluster biogenesis protein NfuA